MDVRIKAADGHLLAGFQKELAVPPGGSASPHSLFNARRCLRHGLAPTCMLHVHHHMISLPAVLSALAEQQLMQHHAVVNADA
mmetsp:Transcript_12977/g.37723  ORF Transcript_12977/g.37723 Transcript_12977/m.37723 type:complete len:83 (+) Transcript_12977:3021-3269(+)